MPRKGSLLRIDANANADDANGDGDGDVDVSSCHVLWMFLGLRSAPNLDRYELIRYQ
jgi:hypothetical protein